MTHRAGRRRVTTERGCIRIHPLMLDRDARRLCVGEVEVLLSRVEFDLLELLMDNPRHVIERETIAREVWGGYVSARTLESTIARIRRKVQDAGGPRIIECARGYGYRLGISVPPVVLPTSMGPA